MTHGRNDPGPTRSVTDFGINHFNPKSLHTITDIQNSIFWITSIQRNLGKISVNRIMDIQKSNFGYPIFNLDFLDIQIRFIDILNFDFWIFLNRIMDIQKSSRILDIQKLSFGHP